MTRRPPRSTRTDTLFPYTTLFRSCQVDIGRRDDADVDMHRPVAAQPLHLPGLEHAQQLDLRGQRQVAHLVQEQRAAVRSEEHTSELQSLMRISYAVFCLKKKKQILIDCTYDDT